MTESNVLDSVLERFATTGPEYGPGLSNHGPMASEALVVLGRPEAAEAWAEECLREYRLMPDPAFIAAAKDAVARIRR